MNCELLSHYLRSIRPGILNTSKNSDITPINSHGKTLGYYSGPEDACKHYHLPELPTLTLCQKAGASAFGKRKYKNLLRGLKNGY